MTEAEQIMKRCQAGTRNYEEANNLHAACYGMIGKLLLKIKELESQEPVAWQFMNGSNFRKRRPDDFADLDSDGLPYWKPLYTTPPQRTEQEPVVCNCNQGQVCHICDPITPSQRTEQETMSWKHDCAALLQNNVELWVDRCPHCGKPRTTHPPTHPPQRTWVGLFNEEIEVLFQTAAGADEEVHIRFARAIEAKMKELNT